jgi:flagellar biosynthesis protein FlhB
VYKLDNTIETLDSYLFRIGLQFFADDGDKTEEATAKKKSDVRKKGQVPTSQELTSAIILLTAFIFPILIQLKEPAKFSNQ